MSLKEIIKDNYVYFGYLRQGFAYYRVNYLKDVYQFTIPLDDIGTGTLHAKMKAIECMRWIRKALESNEFIKA